MRDDTVACTFARPERSTASTAWGGTSFMMSISPESSAAIRALNSGMNLNVTRAASAGTPQKSGLRSSTSRSSRRHSTNLNGPVPIGFSASFAGPRSLRALAGMMSKLVSDAWSIRFGHGCLVRKRTV